MRKVVLQLFLNKHKIVKEIEELQSVDSDKSERGHRALIDAKHEEWDRTEHLIDLFFESINM